MNLHTCPHCQTPALYDHALDMDVNCHACGVAYTLTRYTQTEKTRITSMVEGARLKAAKARSSRKFLIIGSSCLLVVMIWCAVSIFGLIPDELRIFNRRFASLENAKSLSQAIGLVAIGRPDANGQIRFTEFFTAAAITNDGFMVTTRQVVSSGALSDMWVFIGGRRLDAVPVDVDSIADIGLIMVKEKLESRFRLADKGSKPRLNSEVVSVGFSGKDNDNVSPIKQTYSISKGTISHVSLDNTGTEWIDHSAAIDSAGVGGPMIARNRIVGLNVGSHGVIMTALSVSPLRSRIERMINEARNALEQQ